VEELGGVFPAYGWHPDVGPELRTVDRLEKGEADHVIPVEMAEKNMGLLFS
jgi:hypothetical protein